MRVFVAFFPPPEVQRALAAAAGLLPTDAFRLTAPERVHLTLKFLGEVQPEDLTRVGSALKRIGQHGEPFDAAVSGFGVFPSARRARILWAGIGRGAEGFGSLARAVEDLLEPEGFAGEDRPLVPHLTLGRAQGPVSFDAGAGSLRRLGVPVAAVELEQWKHGP